MAREIEAIQPMTYRLKRYEPNPLMLNQYQEEPSSQSPCEWFSRRFPEQAKTYGPPLLEGTSQELDQINPVALNEDFFAAILGGDKKLGHHVVFYLPEHQFYFLDVRLDHYAATTEEKLKTLLSQYLVHCGEEMGANVNLKALFDLRQDRQLDRIVKKARSMLAADESFFSLESGNVRIRGPEYHGRMPYRVVMRVLAVLLGVFALLLFREGLRHLVHLESLR